MMRVNMLMAGCFLAQAVYRRLAVAGNGAGGACAGVRFLWSPTVGVVVDRCKLQVLLFAHDEGVVARFASDESVLPVSEDFGAELCSLVEEAGVSLGVDGEVGAETDEVLDPLAMAADVAELAAELLFPVGHVTRTPSPLPVREAAV
jgi:hypothetical protein